MKENGDIAKTQQRVIRVFVSSTFRDMHAEREELVKRIFPQLRKLCEQRSVVWGEVDLRWGITDEQTAEGKVLPICLAEIHRSRPYFIGLLGERYGWIPEKISEELIEKEPWLKEHKSHSVTELEILHGVLNNPDMAEHAYFYFRDPSYLNRLPKDANPDDYLSSDASAKTKLLNLKMRIIKSGFSVHENYANPEALGKLVLKDFTDLINKLYPADEILDPIDRDAIDHEAFAQSRARVYIGRSEYFTCLDEHVRGEGPPLVVLGESGSGKSALLSNWALKYKEAHPGDMLIVHFIGASAYSADWAAMLRRIMGEFKRRFNIEQDIPDKPNALKSEFANWLHMAAVRGCAVLILDALNQLEVRDGAPDLAWLPPEIPANIRLILSTLPGRSLDDLKKRAWPTLTIEPFSKEERKEFIKHYLGLYTKSLSASRAELIASSQQTSNPLYLQALLEELRVFGVHEKLDERIHHYLGAKTIPALYERILARYEEDYERNCPCLVRDIMSLIWAARRGLSETELLDILQVEGKPLLRADWSAFYLAAEQSLVNRSGMINFFHDFLRQAVINKYLPAEKEQTNAHLRLADYFKKHDLTARKADELPWQLAQATLWQRLNDLLSDLTFLKFSFEVSFIDVMEYWALLENNSFYKKDAYGHVFSEPEKIKDKNQVVIISELFRLTGHIREAVMITESLLKYYRELGDKFELRKCLASQKGMLMELHEYERAMLLMKEHERICIELDDKKELGASLGDQAVILDLQKDHLGAMALRKKEERICIELGDQEGISSCFRNQAVNLYLKGDLHGAMALLKESERICHETGDEHGLAMTFNNQALTLNALGDFQGATALLNEVERICKAQGSKAWLIDCLKYRALILERRKDLPGAMAMLKEQERICRELGKKARLQESLGNQAAILMDRKEDFQKAMPLLEEQEHICRELGNKASLKICLGNQALILYRWGDPEGAMSLRKEEERICRELGEKQHLKACLGHQAVILISWGDVQGAMAMLKEHERICRELGDKAGLISSLGTQALVLKGSGDLQGAMVLLKEQELLSRELPDKKSFSASLGEEALSCKNRGDLKGAMRLLKEHELICKELGDKAELSSSLLEQAIILQECGDLKEAMKLLKQRELICKELDDKVGLSACLNEEALILEEWGDLKGAMKLQKKQERICKEVGDKAGLGRSLCGQALILQRWEDLQGAMELLKEQERICRELDARDEGLAMSLINQARLLSKSGKNKEALPLTQEAYKLANDYGYSRLAQQIMPILDAIQISLKNEAKVHISKPHPSANPEKASQINIEYQKKLAEWKGLPWWKRRLVKKPKPLSGI